MKAKTPVVIFKIIHLKRFQFVNGHWIKSHKIVNVQKNDFDPSSFMTKRENGDGD